MARKTSDLLAWLGVASGVACVLGALVSWSGVLWSRYKAGDLDAAGKATFLASAISESLNLGMFVLIVSLPLGWAWVVWRWRSRS